MSAEAAYWAGFILADGWVRYEGGPTLHVDLAAADRKHLLQLRDFIMPTGEVKPTHKGAGVVLRVYGVDLLRQLRRFGIVPRKSYGHPLPILADSEFWPFVRGYFDGDGTVGKYPQRGRAYWHVYWSGQLPFLRWLKEEFTKRLDTGESASLTKKTNGQLNYVGSDTVPLARHLLGDPALKRKSALLTQLIREAA